MHFTPLADFDTESRMEQAGDPIASPNVLYAGNDAPPLLVTGGPSWGDYGRLGE